MMKFPLIEDVPAFYRPKGVSCCPICNSPFQIPVVIFAGGAQVLDDAEENSIENEHTKGFLYATVHGTCESEEPFVEIVRDSRGGKSSLRFAASSVWRSSLSRL